MHLEWTGMALSGGYTSSRGETAPFMLIQWSVCNLLDPECDWGHLHMLQLVTLQSRSPNIVPFHMLDTFLLCNSNFVFKTCHFSDIRLHKMLWPWNLGQRSLKVIESGTMRYIVYGFLSVFYSNFTPKMHHFWGIRFQKCRDLENRVRIRKGHWKCYHSIERIWLPIDVL